MERTTATSLRRDDLYDLGLFAATVAAAHWLGWSADDLIWSLWIASLLLGYAFIVTTVFVGNDGSGDGESSSSLIALALALALFCFINVHFVGFHWGHAVFLNQFFPLVGPSAGLFGTGGPVWLAQVIGTAVERYWPFLVATFLSRRLDFAGRAEADPEGDETLTGPYRNVVRMHLLIFVYVGLRAAGSSGWFLYAVLFFYFFPLDSLKRLAGRARD